MLIDPDTLGPRERELFNQLPEETFIDHDYWYLVQVDDWCLAHDYDLLEALESAVEAYQTNGGRHYGDL